MRIPAAIRDELRQHARDEAPNEACGLVVLRQGHAVRYERGRNGAASPYRFRLEIDPETWFLEDEGYELAVFHSHGSSPPRPSRADLEQAGLWQDRPYLILRADTGELAAWLISSVGENAVVLEREADQDVGRRHLRRLPVEIVGDDSPGLARHR